MALAASNSAAINVGDDRQEVTLRKKEAETALRGLLGDVDKGAHVAPAKIILQDWARDWIKLKAAERQHKTVARYEDRWQARPPQTWREAVAANTRHTRSSCSMPR
jgi:hypothetical protein